MPIEIHLDRILVERKMTLVELSRRVGVTNVNLSKLKTGKVNGIRFSTLEAICDALDCQPGDIMEFRRDSDEDDEERGEL
ncbi:MAG: helix-turn-helix transcriptional regulator [Candidatus Methanomethylophilaceae archaeon]|nr:helix-turn-helix transcriptional regulator [Candidatus Methanomethylophilaceae archaeon]